MSFKVSNTVPLKKAILDTAKTYGTIAFYV